MSTATKLLSWLFMEENKKSGLYLHAKKELELLGMYNGDELEEITANSILKMIEAWGEVGHSSGSAMWTREVVYKLLGWENLSPITNNSDEWEDVSEISDKPMWQNKRNPAIFSEDGGKTWWNVNEKKKKRAGAVVKTK